MAKLTVTVPDGVGLHARPAAVFVQTAARVPAGVTIGRPGSEPINAKSILAVLGLDVRGGEEVVIEVEDGASDEALELLRDAVLNPDGADG